IFKKVEEGMGPVEAAHKGSQEIFFAVISTSITLAAVFLPVIFLEGFIGRLFREFGVVLAGAVLISAFVSLSLTPMLNAKLIRKEHKHSRFYNFTEPFFVRLNESYGSTLSAFMQKRYVALFLVAASFLMIFGIGNLLQSELAPLEDRSYLRMSVSAPEGSSFEYTDAFMFKIVDLIRDSVPEKRV